MSTIADIKELIMEHDGEYEQTLWTILYNIPEKEYRVFKKMLKKARKTGNKLAINDSDFEEIWDSFSIKSVVWISTP